LLAAAEGLGDAAATGGHDDAALMRASRALAPVYYTSGDRFEHDPALPLPAWPVLQPLRDLAKSQRGSDAAHALTVSATRGRNRLLHALREATGALGGR
ncbi:MAG TPA: aminopeptidase, partial [Acetobacteraceae bacterium]|nr:aminopeptidase [Acetobacteraceae bacterium]